jgi:site-specific DNA-methyltransferase (adenine-specific)
MKPYFEDDAVTIYHGDCRDILPSLPKVDLVLTDPPYGLQDRNMRNCVAFMDVSWDIKVDDSLINQVILCGQNAIIFGGNYYALPPCRGFIVWDKGETILGRSWAECEMAWTNFDCVARIYKLNPNNKDGKDHPTQKPLPLIEWIIANYSTEQNLILDPFMGSGTTLRAAKNLGRKAIGIEIEEKYCEIAAKRMAQTVMNMEV